MEPIKIRKASPEELYDRASHLGMVEAHAQHTLKLQDTMSRMKRTNGRRAEFANQVSQHMAASAQHFKAAHGPADEPGRTTTFKANPVGITPLNKRKNN